MPYPEIDYPKLELPEREAPQSAWKKLRSALSLARLSRRSRSESSKLTTPVTEANGIEPAGPYTHSVSIENKVQPSDVGPALPETKKRLADIILQKTNGGIRHEAGADSWLARDLSIPSDPYLSFNVFSIPEEARQSRNGDTKIATVQENVLNTGGIARGRIQGGDGSSTSTLYKFSLSADGTIELEKRLFSREDNEAARAKTGTIVRFPWDEVFENDEARESRESGLSFVSQDEAAELFEKLQDCVADDDLPRQGPIRQPL